MGTDAISQHKISRGDCLSKLVLEKHPELKKDKTALWAEINRVADLNGIDKKTYTIFEGKTINLGEAQGLGVEKTNQQPLATNPIEKELVKAPVNEVKDTPLELPKVNDEKPLIENSNKTENDYKLNLKEDTSKITNPIAQETCP